MLGVGAACLLLALVAGFLKRSMLTEWWCIRNLRSEVDVERIEAARTLRELGSLRAIPTFLEMIEEDERETTGAMVWPPVDRRQRRSTTVRTLTPLIYGLYGLGQGGLMEAYAVTRTTNAQHPRIDAILYAIATLHDSRKRAIEVDYNGRPVVSVDSETGGQ